MEVDDLRVSGKPTATEEPLITVPLFQSLQHGRHRPPAGHQKSRATPPTGGTRHQYGVDATEGQGGSPAPGGSHLLGT